MLSPDRVAVVLVSPENPLNVGFVARAMKCCAVDDLRVVGEWKEIPDQAHRTGTAAPEILDGAKCVATLSEALADCSAAVGFSRRDFDLPVPTAELRTLGARDGFGGDGRVALVFGKESAGLSRDDLASCDLICEIANPGHLSYNLGMAASIALYELVAEKGPAAASAPEAKRPTLSELEAFENMLQANLIPDIRNAEARKALIHQLLVRTNPSRIELQSMFGFLKELIGPRKGLR
ncbi:MAG: hypothetical protein J6Y56_03315 [Fibrobacterales bacterium]|nr:hypothetical protein [Fibrobacterales bacterium]